MVASDQQAIARGATIAARLARPACCRDSSVGAMMRRAASPSTKYCRAIFRAASTASDPRRQIAGSNQPGTDQQVRQRLGNPDVKKLVCACQPVQLLVKAEITAG